MTLGTLTYTLLFKPKNNLGPRVKQGKLAQFPAAHNKVPLEQMICTYRKDEGEHVSTGPSSPGLLGFPCLGTLCAKQPSMAVAQQTCAYTFTPFQTLTSSTIPSSPRGEGTLDQGNSSHRQAQTDEVFRRLPASPLMPAHHSQALQSRGYHNQLHGLSLHHRSNWKNVSCRLQTRQCPLLQKLPLGQDATLHVTSNKAHTVPLLLTV